MFLGRIGLHRDTNQGTFESGAEDVQQAAPPAVLCENFRGITYPSVLHHSGLQRHVGIGMLDSVDKSAAAPLHSGKQMAPLHAGRTEGPGRLVGGLVSCSKTLSPCVEMKVEPSGAVAQSVGCHVWMGRSRGPERWNAPRSAAIRWRNAEWWEIVKSTGAGAHDQTWRHRKNNWVRGFEYVLTKILGLDWEVAMLGRDSWQRGKYKFVSELVRRWRGPD